jgi:hypothetical protein
VPHCDPDALALRALGESTSPEDDVHLLSCPVCQSSLDQLRAVVTTARLATGDGPTLRPPSKVWDAVAAQLALADPAAPGVRVLTDTSAVAAAPPTRRGVLVELGSRRRVALLAAAAVVVGLLAGVIGTSVAHRSSSGSVLAQTALAPVDAGDAHGLATLRETSSGRVLRVDLLGLPAAQGYYEVWLMNANTGGAVSLGDLDPSHVNTFDVPAGLRLSDFPYVDVSLEPLDGNPAHSSDSVARGRIGA